MFFKFQFIVNDDTQEFVLRYSRYSFTTQVDINVVNCSPIRYYHVFFCTFRDSLFAFIHVCTWVSSASIRFVTSSEGFIFIYNVVSSAKWMDLSWVSGLHKSFIYNMERSGPRVDPWGTPIVTSRNKERLSLVSTNWVLLLGEERIQFKKFLLKPLYSKFWSIIPW